MPKLTNNEVGNHLSEDHICQGCDRDTLDCCCIEIHDMDLLDYTNYYSDRDYLEPLDESHEEDMGDPYGDFRNFDED